ncbi:30S ribosomal protein S14 [Temperatibacter marinus]|uniref:Small ribosomal subunit protein uS14 n=1 Tax=Temperatibacter marinus TaxID=1456591 RepID=A0AA52H941_9PROT|nr:30S ribosomal protein S14 [Temperatibacter marinus]WND02781.1 30S ribosomal protein S14 [Temperatibacter marinus]
MAKVSSIVKNERRKRLAKKYAAKRAALKAIVMNRELPEDERWMASMQLAALPRNGAATRVRNRCEVTGRPRGVYRKFKMSRIALRELGSAAKIPGITKSSW